MSNRLKTSVKLSFAFVIVLVLLAVVQETKCRANDRISGTANDIVAPEELHIIALKMHRDILDVFIAIQRGTITRDKLYFDMIQEKLAAILKDNDEIAARIRDPEIQKMFTALLKQVQALANSNAEYWKYEQERMKAMEIRARYVESTFVAAEELANTIIRVTLEQYSIEVDGQTYIHADRLSMIQDARNLTNHVHYVRRSCMLYDLAAMGKDGRDRLRKDVEEIGKKMLSDIDKISAHIVTQQSKELQVSLTHSVDKWFESVHSVMKLHDKLVELEEKGDDIAYGIIKDIRALQRKIDEQSANTRNRVPRL